MVLARTCRGLPAKISLLWTRKSLKSCFWRPEAVPETTRTLEVRGAPPFYLMTADSRSTDAFREDVPEDRSHRSNEDIPLHTGLPRFRKGLPVFRKDSDGCATRPGNSFGPDAVQYSMTIWNTKFKKENESARSETMKISAKGEATEIDGAIDGVGCRMNGLGEHPNRGPTELGTAGYGQPGQGLPDYRLPRRADERTTASLRSPLRSSVSTEAGVRARCGQRKALPELAAIARTAMTRWVPSGTARRTPSGELLLRPVDAPHSVGLYGVKSREKGSVRGGPASPEIRELWWNRHAFG
uniref:Uncharacterized protein n=1 Tax=Steinernema glaseri TaxID=37863 RepID=A0A1I7Z9Y4_9BILA